MQTLFICAIIAATLALLLIARTEKRHQKFAYGVAAAVPVFGLLIFFLFMGPKPPPIPVDEKERKDVFLETMHTASEDLTKKLESDPGNPELSLQLTTALMQQVKYDKAIEIIDQSLIKNPSNPDLLQQRAIIHFAKGLYLGEQQKFKEASVSLNSARNFAPKDSPYLKDLDMFIQIMENKANPKKAKKK